MKKLLASLILCLGLIPCFSNADLVGSINRSSYNLSSNRQISITISTGSVNCFQTNDSGIYYRFSSGDNINQVLMDLSGTLYCFDKSFYIYNSNNLAKTFYYYSRLNSIFECPTCPTCPEQYTSLECQTEYNLIPVSSVDSNYCESNNLCSSIDCPDNPNPGTSNVFINDVFHPGAFNVIINIPDEIDWDYAYTNSGNNINIDVVGYNQDTEYINSWIDTNNYKPTSEDFTNTFLLFKDYSGLLIALLFVILVFYLVKKLF